MDKCFEINTKRLVIYKYSPRYLTEKYVSWLNDKDVVKFSEQRHKTHTMDSCVQYFNSVENSDNLFLAIVTRDQSIHIGNITVTVDIHNLVADIAIVIGEKSVWGKGYGKEAFIAVMNHMFLKYEIRKVTAGTMSINYSMLNVMKASGMSIECTKKKQFLVDGEEVDMISSAAWAPVADVN